MRRFAPFLITFSALLPVVVPVLPSGAAGLSNGRPAPVAVPLRTECRQPQTLRLRRFEDGSAQLLCAGQVIVRVSVPW